MEPLPVTWDKTLLSQLPLQFRMSLVLISDLIVMAVMVTPQGSKFL